MQGKYAHQEVLSPHRRLLPVYNQNAALGRNLFIAPNASVVGKVEVKDGSAIWYGAVIRGDAGNVSIGKDTTIGERCVIHSPTGTTEARKTVIGSEVYLGSGSVVNGATIHDKAHIGVGVLVSEGAEIGASKVESGSVIAAGTKIPDNQLWSGNPAKYVRDLSQDEVAELAELNLESLKRSEKHTYWHELTAEERSHLIQQLEDRVHKLTPERVF